MVESLSSNEPNPQRRRTTRVVQSIPLTVTGVDALGQPFKERTSTLMLSCHGCRYPSKHYVPRGSEITLEVPRPEPEQPPRILRGNVIWVQRPRTVRELFQIGVEIETPGNVWGIAFPPADWFAPTDEGPENPPKSAAPQKSEPTPAAAGEATPPRGTESISQGNVRVMPPAGVPATSSSDTGSESALAMARQMARLLAESKPHLQRMVREAAAVAIETQAEMVREQLASHVRQAMEKVMETSIAHITEKASLEVVKQVIQQLHEAKQTELQSVSIAVTEEFRAAREQIKEEIHQGAADALESAMPTLIERSAEAVTKRLESRAAESPAVQSEERSISNAAPDALQEQFSARQKSWEHEFTQSADALFHAQLDSFTRQVGEASQTALHDCHAQLAQENAVITGLSEEAVGKVKQAQTELESETNALRENLRQRLELTTNGAIGEATRRLLEESASKIAEFGARAQVVAAEQAQRIRPLAEAAAQEALAQLRGQAEQQAEDAAAKIAQASEAASAAREELEGALAATHQEAAKISKEVIAGLEASASEVSLRASENLKQQTLQYPAELEKSCREMIAHATEELEAKGTDATHAAFEALYKAAEWYQKKAQTAMQASLDKILDQQGVSLRERAAELSRLFAQELDSYSRNYVEHTSGLMDEALRDLHERGRTELEQSAATLEATFGDQLHAKSEEALTRVAEQMTAAETRAISNFELQRAGSIAEFQTRLREEIETGTKQARETLDARLSVFIQDWNSQREAEAGASLETLKRASDEAIEKYKTRLENASNSWLLASAATLGQHSQGVLETLARAAEQRLRETCSQVFAGLGETLRLRLLGISEDVKPQAPAQDSTEPK